MAKDPKRKAKGFFVLDVYQFDRLRTAGLGVAEAATYLCLLKSTDQSNIISRGGISSVTRWTGLSRADVKKAIQRLQQLGLVEALDVERTRARTVPRHVLPIHDDREKLAPKERQIVEAIRAGRQPSGKAELNTVMRAKAKGYLERRSDGWRGIELSNDRVAFIPNSFVQTSKGVSPLYRLVNHGELAPIMLAVELYQHQNLSEERGIPAAILRRHFGADPEYKQIGRYNLHQLKARRTYTDPSTRMVTTVRTTWDSTLLHDYQRDVMESALEALEETSVVEWTVYSTNGKPEGATGYNRPTKPLGVLRNGKQSLRGPESRVAFVTALVKAAHDKVALDFQDFPNMIKRWQAASPVLVLENASVKHVEGIGILRMTHHVDTINSDIWRRELKAECDDALFSIADATKEIFPQVSAEAELLRLYPSLEAAISM